VGEYDFLGAAFYNDPYPTLTEMRRNDPCWFDHRLGAFVVTRYGDVSRILQDADFSAQRVRQFTRGAPDHLQAKVRAYVESLERWLLFIDPPHHTRLRARLQRAFGPALLPVITVAGNCEIEIREPAPPILRVVGAQALRPILKASLEPTHGKEAQGGE